MERSKPANRDFILTGPQALNYDEVAELVTSEMGKAIVHIHCDAETIAAQFEASGVPKDFASVLASMDLAIAAGAEARTTHEVENLTGIEPIALADFIASNRDLF